MTPVTVEEKNSGTKHWWQVYGSSDELDELSVKFGKIPHQKGDKQKPHLHLTRYETEQIKDKDERHAGG